MAQRQIDAMPVDIGPAERNGTVTWVQIRAAITGSPIIALMEIDDGPFARSGRATSLDKLGSKVLGPCGAAAG